MKPVFVVFGYMKDCRDSGLTTSWSTRQTFRLQQARSYARLMRKLSRSERFSEPPGWLMSVPGIGQLSGMAFISEIDDISRFKNADRLASYIGMIPMCHSIGEHDGTGDITLRCHSMLRCMLIEAAWVAIRQDSAMTQVRNIVAG